MAISEDASRDYQKTSWAPGMPITQERMTNIEDNVYINREAIQALDNELTTNTSNIGSQITELNDTVNGYSSNNTIKSAIDDLRTRIGAIGTGSADGTAALTQIVNALTNSEAVTYNDLKARLDAIENMKKLFGKKLDPNDQTGTTYIDAFNTTDSTVYATITGLYTTISNLSGLISTNTSTVAGLATKITEATNYFTDPNLKVFNTLAERMNSLDDRIKDNYDWIDAAKGSDDTLAEHIARIYNDVINAHTSSIIKHTENGTEVDTTFNSLDERFETDEANIRSNTQAITSLTQDTISIQNGGIVDTFDSHDTDKALSANRGRILRNIIGGPYTGEGTSTVANGITNAQANAQAYADTNKVAKSDIYNDLDYVPAQDATADKVLDARQGKVLQDEINALNTALNTNDTGIIARVTAAEAALDTLNGTASTAGSVLNTVNTQIATVVNDAPAAFDTLKEIADWIGTHSTSALEMQQNITALQNTINDQTTGLAATKAIADAAAVKTEVDSSLNGLDTRLDAIDGGETLTGNTLASRVGAAESAITALQNEPKSATVIISVNDFDALTANEANSTKDYLVGPDSEGLYKYYRIIETSTGVYEKVIISGGGSGSSSAEFYDDFTQVPQSPSENVDYFIGGASNYIHYRYINGTWERILPPHILTNASVDTSTVGTQTKSRPVIKELGSDTNLLGAFTAIKSITATQTSEGTKLTWVDIDGGVSDVTISGGGGSSSSVIITLNRVGDADIIALSDETCNLSFDLTGKDASGEDLSTTGTCTWFNNNIRVATSTAQTGTNTFDIGPYLQTGVNNIVLSTVVSVDGETFTRTKTWTVTVINFSLTWEYEESTINSGSTLNFTCIPYGTDITKTVHLKINSVDHTDTVTTSGIPKTISIQNNLSHGSYTAEMWLTATIGGEPMETQPHIFHDIIIAESGNTTPIISATLPSASVNQYDMLTIPFVVYTPTSSLSTVELAVDGVVQDVREDINRNTQTWNYTPSTEGTKTLTLTSGSVTKTLTLVVNRVEINNNEISGYTFKLKANEIPSNTALQAWTLPSTNTKLQFSENFDWINGGIQTELDENGQQRQFIKVKAGTTMIIPYKMFYGTDPRENGCNLKIVFKVQNCRNYDAVIATNIAENIGIELKAHDAIFKSNATQVSTQYGENEYTELEFELYKNHLANGDEAPNPYIMAWIDGVITSARPYTGNFVQTEANAKNIVIGSEDCDVNIYLVKYYPTVLDISSHIANFIADAPNASEMVKRYNRNNILDDDGDIDPNKLAEQNKDCRVWLYDMTRMTTGKKDYVAGVSFQQIYKNGTLYQNGLHGKGTLTVQGTSSVNYRKGAANTDINFYDTKDGRLAQCELFDGQGNNLLADDLPVKGFKINETSLPITYSNMKVNFASCEQVNNMCNAEWYEQFQPYPSLSTRDCMEFVMGVQFIHDQGLNEPAGEVILFNEKGNKRKDNKFYMYSIGNLGTSKKNTHIFHSDNECCIEINNNENAGCRMKTMPEDLAADYTAYLEGNYNNMSHYDWSGDTDGKDHSYGMRFPDTKNPETDIKAGWARFVKWMVENNPDNATGDALDNEETYTPYTFRGHIRQGTQVLRGVTVSQYAGTYDHDTFERRMAKMLSECEDYMAMDSVVYHFLFIERHTMVDNVSKNTFWSAAKSNQYINGVEQPDTEGYWIWDLSKNYDNDTSDGNNNEGQLIFDYGNEAADRQDGKAVFNASDAAWFVFTSNLYEACRAMFQNRETAVSKNGKYTNAWNSRAYHNYLLSEQRKVPERVWNECYWYDYLRTYETGKVKEDSDQGQIIDKSWITFLDGGQKTHQRQHYETFEELYDASKYRSNMSTANSITLRGYTPDNGDPSLEAVPAKSELTIKMYNKCYLTAHFGDNIETTKVGKGESATLQFLENGQYMKLSDTVINIDTASMIQEISDLAPLYPGQASFSAATRLRYIKIGDSTPGYNNPHITNTETGTVDFGANAMLEHLEVQNLSNANQPLNLTGCPALTYLDARGSTFTSITFANGGLLNEAYLNNPTSLTMRNLDFLALNKFTITDPTALTQLRLEGGKLFDKLTFIQTLTNLNILRLVGIDWTLNDSVLLNRLLAMMGMNELGYTVAQSYLAGDITLYGTVYSGNYDQYTAAWAPDLSIDISHATYVQQHLVIYQHEDGTELYRTYIEHGNNIIDPWADKLISEPTKAADIQNTYSFGTLNSSEKYIAFSGWRKSNESTPLSQTADRAVEGELTIITVFTATPQRYTVRWLMRENAIVAESTPQNYGGGQNLVAPTIQDVQNKGYNTYEFSANGNLCSYRIMTGWEKLPTNITPTTIGGTYDIYPTWLERTSVNYMTVLTSNDYSQEEKLLVYKELSSARTNTTIDFGIRDMFPIVMGYNGVKPGIELVSTPLHFTDGDSPVVINDYMPFAANKSFTITIDYRFDAIENNIASEAVLISCYNNANSSVQGFKLFYNPKLGGSGVPQVSFGSTSSSSTDNVKSVGNTINNRNIIVLRHRAGDANLYVYSGANTTGLISNYSNAAFRQTCTWSGITSDAKIVLGGIISNDTSMMNAFGTLYSVKYWEEDLGEGECFQLASWCHETMYFAVADYTEAEVHSSRNGTLNAAIVLHTVNASQAGTITEDNIIAQQPFGWEPSVVRMFYNNRIYHGLPILLQSIMRPLNVPYNKAIWNGENYTVSSGTNYEGDDYVFAVSFREVGDDTTGTYSIEANGPYTWHAASTLTVKTYNAGALNDAGGDAAYTNLRFPYYYNGLNANTTVYINYPLNGQDFYTWMSNENGVTLTAGDILITDNDPTNAYMYVTAADINNGAPVIRTNASALQAARGGWIESRSWWTRSVPNNVYSTNIAKFIYTSGLGRHSSNGGNAKTHGIVYSIGL